MKNSLAGPVQGRGYSLGDSRRNKSGGQLPGPYYAPPRQSPPILVQLKTKRGKEAESGKILSNPPYLVIQNDKGRKNVIRVRNGLGCCGDPK